MLSNTTIYGIRALIYIADHSKDGKEYIPINRLADDINLSFHFLTKILQKLTHAKLLKSYRGPNGGVALVKQPEEISVYEIVQILETKDMFTECILGLPGCGHTDPCPFHEEWIPDREQLRETFSSTNILDMAKKLKIKNKRLG